MPPQLVALTEGPSILLDKPIILIGRHQECDIQIPSRKISRRHCCIAQVNDHLVVRDLCSTNGIRINGIRVMEGILKPGDELTIGNFQYRVLWDAQPSPEGAQPPLGDNPFESCELPVPLNEPDERPPSKHLAPPPDAPASLVLPENIDLAPVSDLFSKSEPPPQPSSS